MRFGLLVVLFVLAVAAPVYAVIETADVSFAIQDDLSVDETITVVFDEPLNETVDYTLNERISSILVSDSDSLLVHELIEANGTFILRIFPEGDKTLVIKFVSDSLVFQNNNIYQFFTELSFAETVKTLEVIVTLPEGFGIFQNSYSPSSAAISSDGRNIQLLWSFNNFDGPEIFSVKFERLGVQLNIWIPIALLTLIGLGFLYKHYNEKLLKEKEKSRQEFYVGFREDEKKVIEYLEKHNTAYQNKIEHEFKFSRAKMTRIVKKLQEKGLVHKKRKGRTNRLTWVKK